MIVAFGAAANFFVQSLAYVCILGTVLLIRTPRRARSGQPRPTVWSGIIEGFGYSRRNPQMRLLLLMSAINPVFYIPIHDALMPIFAASALPGGAQTLGLLLGALGAGGLLGGIVTASLSHVDRRGLMQLVALLVHGLSLASFSVAALVTHQLWLALSILLISGIAESLHLATNQTVVQLLAPNHLRGRVTSILQFSMVLNAIGVFGAGVLADHVGPTGAGIALSLSGFVLTASILIGSSKMRTLRLSRLKELGQTGLRPAAPGG